MKRKRLSRKIPIQYTTADAARFSVKLQISVNGYGDAVSRGDYFWGMKRKKYLIDFLRRSEMSDLTCRDGEVDSFDRISWLEPESDNPDSKNPGATSKPVVEYERVPVISCGEPGAGLPLGSSLLAVHTVRDESGSRELALYLQSNGALGFRPLYPGVARNIGFLPASHGALKRALCFRNIVTLLCADGVAWLCYEPSLQSYRLLSSLPEAPEITATFDETTLDGYVTTAGQQPEMTLNVDLHDLTDLIDGEALSEWLNNGHSARVDEAIQSRVHEGIADRVNKYMAEVRDAGLFLKGTRVVASFGEAMPCNPVIVTGSYNPPYAKLLEWALRKSTLYLKVAFSLKPLRLTISYQLTDLQLQWRGTFSELTVFTTSETPWMIGSTGEKSGKPEVTGLYSLTSESVAGLGFRFGSRSRASVIGYTRSLADFRKSASVNLDNVTAGVLTVTKPSSTEKIFTPCYDDFLPVKATGGATTDSGVILFDGNTVLSPLASNCVVYRHREMISDGNLLAITQCGGKGNLANGKKHPLLAISTDGLRKLSSVADSGYEVTEILGKEPFPDSPLALTEVDDGIAILTERGLEIVAFSGKKLVDVGMPDGLRNQEEIGWMVYDHASKSLLASIGNMVTIFDREGNRWHDSVSYPVSSIAPPVGCKGKLMVIGSDNTMRFLKIEYDYTPAIPATFALANGKCSLTTRALKFGTPFSRKRILSIDSAVEMEFVIEGSDDLLGWRKVASGVAPIKSIHVPRQRFFRLSITADEELSDHLHRICMTVLE